MFHVPIICIIYDCSNAWSPSVIDTVFGAHTNLHVFNDIGAVLVKIIIVLCRLIGTGCSCELKSINVFNTACDYGNCWTVGWLSIVGVSPITHNCLMNVVGLWLNCLSVVDLRCFAIISCCVIVKIYMCCILCCIDTIWNTWLHQI